MRFGRGAPVQILAGAIWLCFLAKAVFYASFLPLWEGQDEYTHFAYEQYLASAHSLPPRDASVSREVAESLQLAPVPWTIRRSPLWLPYDDFWRLTPGAREEREKLLRAMPRAWGRQPAQPSEPLYESQQPPLAYIVLGLPYRIFEGSDLTTRAWVLRVAGAAIASLAIPLSFLIASRVFRSPWRAVGMVAIVASMPELLLHVTRVSNESLAVLAGTACTLSLISLPDRLQRTPLPGIALGCALLTKAYFLALLPVAGGIYAVFWLPQRERRRAIALHAAITFGTALAIGGWWYARNMLLTGTLTGEIVDVASRQSVTPLMQALVRANWLHTLDFALTTHIWLGGWSFLVVRTWMYRAVEMLLAAGVLGVALRLGRKYSDAAGGPLAICAALAGCIWIAPAYQALVTYRARGVAETMGYYAYCLVAAEAVCLVAGISALLPRRWARFAAPGMVVCFAALEVFGAVFMLMPYYAGFTVHSASGSVPAMHFGMLSGGGFDRLFANLAAFRPIGLSGGVLEWMWAAFMAAVVGIVGIAFWAAYSDRGEA